MFRSVVELQAAIKRFLAETNADPRPFRWTKDPDKIIAAVKRGHQVLEFYPLALLWQIFSGEQFLGFPRAICVIHRRSAYGGPTMDEDWRIDLERWLEPFLAGLSHPARRRMCPPTLPV